MKVLRQLPYGVLRTAYCDWQSVPRNAPMLWLGTSASRTAIGTGHSRGLYANRRTSYGVRSTGVVVTPP
jgi:hypothetical protein